MHPIGAALRRRASAFSSFQATADIVRSASSTSAPVSGPSPPSCIGPGSMLRGQAAWHLPGDEVWLVSRHRSSGERKCHLPNPPPEASLKRLAPQIKAR